MPKRRVMHVVPSEKSGWAVQEQGGKSLKSFSRKDEAVDWAIEEGKSNMPSQVKIHKEDGTFEEERTYGNDPYPPRG